MGRPMDRWAGGHMGCLYTTQDLLYIHFELQKNEVKPLKRLSRAQNRTLGRSV
jgi:hypothetical protein